MRTAIVRKLGPRQWVCYIDGPGSTAVVLECKAKHQILEACRLMLENALYVH